MSLSCTSLSLRANNTYALLGGKWAINNLPRQLSAGSAQCDPASYDVSIVGHHANCTSAVAALCMPAVPLDLCYCTSYGHDDECYIEYYMQTFNGAITPLDSDPQSNVYRGGRTMYWHKFEFVLDFTITNYAMLSTTLPL